MAESIINKISMTSVDIALLVGCRHDNVKRTVDTLADKGVIAFPQTEKKPTTGRPLGYYVFEGEQGKRDSIIVVARLSPEFTARLVDRWSELEEQVRKPMTEIEMVAALAMEAVRQQKRLERVEEKISCVAETVEQIKRGTIREGFVGYRQLVAKSGMSDSKCRNLVNAYQIPVDVHEFMTPDGLLSRRTIVALEPFMAAFHRMMKEAEQRGTRWYHPKMGIFQMIGWE
ncbi:DNA-binding protein [Escherichia coli]|nr:DNA-binding protein [Escherichia coli]EEV0712217.1 DNA-binding protein [Escherichia coli]EEV7679028.1 DNA-binding protein [Escherichia coli]EFF0150998.1 DNA-binding protein [Escherichia coli]EFF0211462.1 DNA-binding protein [Escherichia coli]